MSVLSEELREKIKAYLARYPSKQALTLPALHLVQDELRCVPLEAVREIADLLDLSPAEVNDTMSFYGFFKDEQHKLGKTRLWCAAAWRVPCATARRCSGTSAESSESGRARRARTARSRWSSRSASAPARGRRRC